MSSPMPQERGWTATCFFSTKTATVWSSARTSTCCDTSRHGTEHVLRSNETRNILVTPVLAPGGAPSRHGTEYVLRSNETRNILVTPVLSTSSVLNGVTGRCRSFDFSSFAKTSAGRSEEHTSE